jgi:ABC-type branched-subunit amino acid transport system ATPase component/ABC-type branched-subunit amino acid transport system permease subunit
VTPPDPPVSDAPSDAVGSRRRRDQQGVTDRVAAALAGRSGWLLVVALLGFGVIGPAAIPLGAARLAALGVAVTGASLLIGRAGAADLATAAAMGAGAYLGGVASALLGLPAVAGLLTGALAGALVGTVSGALHGRLGRTLGALASLAVGIGLVAVAAALPIVGGVAGFHAVGLLAPAGPRSEAAVAAAVLLAALLTARAIARSGLAARGSVAVHTPVVAAACGRPPGLDAAALGGVAGGLLGAGGALLAAVDGSVLPAAYGLELAAGLALAALVGGAPPFGPLIGTLLVWGPNAVWPLVPLVGTAPPLLVMGPIGLAVVAARRGRPVAGWSETASVDPPGGGTAAPARAHDRGHPAWPRPLERKAALTVERCPTPAGPVTLAVAPGEIVAVQGPNGAGKSTLVARIGGQLPDAGSVRLDGSVAPRGVRRRARQGVARSWQRPPDVVAEDLLRLVAARPDGAAAGRWAADALGHAGPMHTAPPGVLQLVAVAARRPTVALLDEPTDLPPERLATYVRGLAEQGAAVLVIDHRPAVVAAAHRVVTVGSRATPGPPHDEPLQRRPVTSQRHDASAPPPVTSQRHDASAPPPAVPRPRSQVALWRPRRRSRVADGPPPRVRVADGPRSRVRVAETPPPRVRVVVDEPAWELMALAGQVVELPDDDRLVASLVASASATADGRSVQLELDGRGLGRRSPARRVRAGLAVVSGAEVASDLEVGGHLAAVVAPRVAEMHLATSPSLAGRGADPAGVLSGGERRQLGWLVAVVVDPRAVILDRAGTGLDRDAFDWAHRQLDRWLDSGVAVLVRPGRQEERRWLTHRADGTPRSDR